MIAAVSCLICPVTGMTSHTTHHTTWLLSQAACLYSLLISHGTSPLMRTHFYLQMTMSCGSWWNLHIAHVWHSILYLIPVLTIQKESSILPLNFKSKSLPLKTSTSFVFSNPLALHFVLLLLHFAPHTFHLTLHNTVHPVLSLCPFDYVVFSFCLLHTYCFCHLLNLHSLSSLHIILHFCYFLLRLLAVMLGDYYYSPQYRTLWASKGFHSDQAPLHPSLTITAMPLGISLWSCNKSHFGSAYIVTGHEYCFWLM